MTKELKEIDGFSIMECPTCGRKLESFDVHMISYLKPDEDEMDKQCCSDFCVKERTKFIPVFDFEISIKYNKPLKSFEFKEGINRKLFKGYNYIKESNTESKKSDDTNFMDDFLGLNCSFDNYQGKSGCLFGGIIENIRQKFALNEDVQIDLKVLNHNQ